MDGSTPPGDCLFRELSLTFCFVAPVLYRLTGPSPLPTMFPRKGVAVWIALSRRSNGMTGRSVKGHGSAGFRTTEVRVVDIRNGMDYRG